MRFELADPAPQYSGFGIVTRLGDYERSLEGGERCGAVTRQLLAQRQVL